MSQTVLYTIGETAKICDISVQTLRFYDKIGLIHPTSIDRDTGYRRYSNHDVLRVKIVQDLRGMQFSLDDIASVLNHQRVENVVQVMKLKREEALRQIQSLEGVVSAMDRRLENLALQQWIHANAVDTYCELQTYPDRPVAFNRRRSGCGMEPYILRFTELMNTLRERALGATDYFMTIYHEDILSFDRNDSDIEVCVPVTGAEAGTPNTRTLSGGSYLSASYRGIGDDETCKRTYRMLLGWMEENDYAQAGPVVERYLVDLTSMLKPEEFIIELQIPVQKVLTL